MRKSWSKIYLLPPLCKPLQEQWAGRPPSVYAGATNPHFAYLNLITVQCVYPNPHYAYLNLITLSYSFKLLSIHISAQNCKLPDMWSSFDDILLYDAIAPPSIIKKCFSSKIFCERRAWFLKFLVTDRLLLHTYSIRPLWYAQMENQLERHRSDWLRLKQPASSQSLIIDDYPI